MTQTSPPSGHWRAGDATNGPGSGTGSAAMAAVCAALSGNDDLTALTVLGDERASERAPLRLDAPETRPAPEKG